MPERAGSSAMDVEMGDVEDEADEMFSEAKTILLTVVWIGVVWIGVVWTGVVWTA